MLEISNGIYSIKRCKKVIPGTKEKLYQCRNKKLQKAQINPNITNAGDSGVSENTRCGKQNSSETTNPTQITALGAKPQNTTRTTTSAILKQL